MIDGLKINKLSISILSITVLLISSSFIYFNDYDYAVAIIFTLFSYFLVFITMKRYPQIRRILFIAFTIRLIMAWYYSLTFEADPDRYQIMAEYFYNMNAIEFIKSFQTGAYLYSWFVSIIWRITGINTIIIRIVNALISVYCCFLAYKISIKLFKKEKEAIKVFYFLALFPNLVRFSASFASRETVFVMFLMISIYCLIEYFYSKKIRYSVIFFIFTFMGIIIHISAAFLLFGYICVTFTNIRKKTDILKCVLLLTIMIIGVVYMYNKGIGTEKLYINKGGISAEKIAWIQEASSYGRAAYLTGFSSNNIFLTILMLPIRIAFFLFTPFIWMIRNSLDILGFVDSLLYLWVVKKIYVSYKEYENYESCKISKYILYSIAIMIAVFSIGTSNYGTAIRHRAKLITPLTILATPAINKKGKNNHENRNNNAVTK